MVMTQIMNQSVPGLMLYSIHICLPAAKEISPPAEKEISPVALSQISSCRQHHLNNNSWGSKPEGGLVGTVCFMFTEDPSAQFFLGAQNSWLLPWSQVLCTRMLCYCSCCVSFHNFSNYPESLIILPVLTLLVGK